MLNLRTVQIALLAVCVAAAASAPAQAAVVTFTDRGAFNAATFNQQVITFEGLAPVNLFTFFNSPPGLTQTTGLGNVNFQGTGNRLFVIDPGFAPPAFVFNSGQYLQNNNFGANAPLVATLPPNTFAVGSDVSAQVPGLAAFTVTLSTGEVFTFTEPGRPNFQFVGFTSDVPIASIAFNVPGRAVTLDNFTLAEVPEPGSLALLGLGVAGLAGYGWRRRKAA